MMANPRAFLLRYVGSRFAGHRLPLDVLPDLSAFRDLLVAFVKAEWRATHEKRIRLPKGFEKSIAFDLVEIADGSAVPKLEWDRAAAQLLLPEFQDELEGLVEKSYSEVMSLIDGAADGGSASEMPSDSIRALNRFGSGLLQGERIEFPGSRGRDGNVVYLDFARRKRLITRDRDTYQTRFEDIGRLLGSEKSSDGADARIVVGTVQHGRIEIPISPERVKEEFDGSMDADVQFRLTIELDNNDVFKRVVDVFDVDIIDAKLVGDLERCRTRIAKLASLTSGWHDGVGLPPTLEAARVAGRLLSARPQLAGHYHIYPTDDGGIQFEFVYAGWDYSIEILPDGAVEIFGVQTEGPDDLDARDFPELNGDALAFLDSLIGEAR